MAVATEAAVAVAVGLLAAGGSVTVAVGVGASVDDGVAVSVGMFGGAFVAVAPRELAGSPVPSVHPAVDIATIPIIKALAMA